MAGNGIGTRRESSLHAALKAYYAEAGDKLEAIVDGYVIDVVRGDLLIEIQSGNFSAVRAKLMRLADEGYRLQLVYPLAVERRIVRLDANGALLSQRKSPKRGRIEEIFAQVVYITALAQHPNFSCEVVFVRDAVIWRNDGQKSWRRKGWRIVDRQLLSVVGSQRFSAPADYRRLLPEHLTAPFTVSELAAAAKLTPRLADKMVYSLRQMGQIRVVGQRGRARLYDAHWLYSTNL